MKDINISTKWLLLILILITTLFYLPIILDPSLLLSRNNDLQEFFYPIIYYIKQTFFETHTLPLWNNVFLSGTPLLPDPQSMLFYPPNIIFLLLPIDQAFILFFITHSFFSAVSLYFCLKNGFSLTRVSSIFAATAYLISPINAGLLEAGHVGLFASVSWLPLALLSVIKVSLNPRKIWSIILAICLSCIFFTHVLIFLFSTLIAIILSVILSLTGKTTKKSLLYLSLSLILTFGLTAISLLPQLEWQGQTTRYLLLQNRDVYPKWQGKSDFFQTILMPTSLNPEKFRSIDTAKWIPLGKIIILLSVVGLFALTVKYRLITIMIILLSLLFVLNNASPIYQLMIKQDSYALNRVTTRIWPLVGLLFIILASLGVERLIKKKVTKVLVISIIIFCFAELLFLSWGRITKPVLNVNFAPSKLYDYLTQDKNQYRVFCTNNCLSQKEAAKRRLELLDGYSTITQLNYFYQSWQLMGGYWGYYTLSIPPIGYQEFNTLTPDPKSLGEYNVKYIISPKKLADPNFIDEAKFDNYFVYKNNLFKNRAYFLNQQQKDDTLTISSYQPNYIKIDIKKAEQKQLVIAQVYSEGWKALLDGKTQVPVQKTPNSLSLINLESETKYVEFVYRPKTFQTGLIITLLTIITTTFVFLGRYFKRL